MSAFTKSLWRVLSCAAVILLLLEVIALAVFRARMPMNTVEPIAYHNRIPVQPGSRDDLALVVFGETDLPMATVDLDYGLSSTVVIYHSGHTGLESSETALINDLNSAGVDVVRLDMPFIGNNAGNVLYTSAIFGRLTLNDHDDLLYLEPDTTPLRLFLEPVIITINSLTSHYNHIAMVGLSGGGWTTTVAAALDERIAWSMSIAGTVPGAYRTVDTNSAGDYEQRALAHAGITYPTLYTLAASDDRRHYQVYNLHDDCCFALDSVAFETDVQAIAPSFQAFVDNEARGHEISDSLRALIVSEIYLLSSRLPHDQ